MYDEILKLSYEDLDLELLSDIAGLMKKAQEMNTNKNLSANAYAYLNSIAEYLGIINKENKFDDQIKDICNLVKKLR